MIFEGKVYKSGKSKYWLIEIPALDLMTQGESKTDAFEMIQDALSLQVDRSGFRSRVWPSYSSDRFLIETNEDAAVIALLLRRQRAKSGLTIREVAKLLGVKSANAYAAYESGKREPSISKVDELLSVVSKQDRLRIRVG